MAPASPHSFLIKKFFFFRWEKPDETSDFEKTCEGSFFYALLERCLRAGETVEAVLPPMREFLASIEAKHEAWLRALIENAFNLAVKRCQSEFAVPMEM